MSPPWSEPATTHDEHDVGDYASVLRARKWTIVVITLVVLAVALILSVPQHAVYSSKATVLIGSQSNTSSQNQQTMMATEKKLAGSTAVADSVVQALKLNEGPDEVLTGLSLTVPLDTTIIQFHYAYKEPHGAQRRAQAFADGYLAYRRQQLVDSLSATSQSIQDQIGALNDRVNALQKAGKTDPKQIAASKAEVSTLTSEIATLQQQLAVLSAAAPASGGAIIERASFPTKPSPPKRLRDGLLGLAAGLVLGVFGALAQEHTDDRIRGPEDLEGYLSAPILGTIPLSRGTQQADGEIITMMQDDPPVAEGTRRLGVNLVLALASTRPPFRLTGSSSQAGWEAILVTSARENEGTTLVTANLGVVLAHLGKSVILVSANTRAPRLEHLFGLASEPGLTSVLMEQLSLASALCKTGVVDLRVLPAGSAVGNPSALFGFASMSTVLEDLRRMADLVLVDAPPLLTASDTAVMLPACDAVLFVANARSATRRTVVEVRQQLRRANAHTIGSVVVGGRPYRSGARHL